MINRSGCPRLLLVVLFSSITLPTGFGESPKPVCRISPATRDANGLLTHAVESSFQAGTTEIHVLPPDRMDQGSRYSCLYVLPVEAGNGTRYGNGLLEIKKLDVHNRHQWICVAPTFSAVPWYADHPLDPTIRQESYFLQVVVPTIDQAYSTRNEPAGRLLVGFSKSGWGAFSLLLRHPAVFGKAAAWDVPWTMDSPVRYGTAQVFGTPENFQKYRIDMLLEQQAMQFQGTRRLIHLGYGNFRSDHQTLERLLLRLNASHGYLDGPQREHTWGSGWLPEAVAALASKDP